MAQPANLRTGLPVIIRQPTVPFTRRRIEDPTPDELAKQLHEIQETVHDVTQGIRQMPEGGARTYFKDVAFVSGVAKKLNHLLGVSTSVAGQYTQASQAVASMPAQIKFELLNHRTAFGGAYRSAVDARTITLVPNATFTADVRLFVVA